MQWDLTNSMAKIFTCWDLHTDLWEPSTDPDTAAQLSGRIRAAIWQQRLLHYHEAFRLCYSHQIYYIILWHALFQSFYIYTYGQYTRTWQSSIIGGAWRHTHWESLEMYHFEAIGVKQWSRKAESPPSTFCYTSQDIEIEFFRTSSSCSRSIGIGWQNMGLASIENPRNLGPSKWNQILGNRECICTLYDKMRWKWGDVDLL